MRLRVAFPFIGVEVSGAVMSAADTFRRLIEDGRVDPVAILPRDGPAIKVFEDVGAEVVLHGDSWTRTTLKGETSSWGGKLRAVPTYTSTWRYATEFLGTKEYHIVHINEDRNVLPWGLAARLRGVPAIWHVRQEKPKPWLDWLRIRLVDQMLFVSNANVRARFGTGAGLPPHDTLYNSVDIERFRPSNDKPKLRDELGLDQELPLLLFVGNLFPRKRPHWALEATALLQARFPMQTVILGAPLGDQEYLSRLSRLSEESPQPQHVHIVGSDLAVESYYSASDVVTLPSIPHGEAFPRVVIEAMASGVPVVATSVAGIPEAVVHGTTGLLVDASDFDAYVASIAALLSDLDLRKRMADRAAEVARERFSGIGVADYLVSVYAKLVGTDS